MMVKLTDSEGDIAEDQRQVRSVSETDSSQLYLSPARPARPRPVARHHGRSLLLEVGELQVALQGVDEGFEHGFPLDEYRDEYC